MPTVYRNDQDGSLVGGGVGLERTKRLEKGDGKTSISGPKEVDWGGIRA